MRILNFKDAIREAQEQCLEEDPSVFLIGEGVGDPKNIFGTTSRLNEKFPERVFDMPISENGVTGVCVGAAINGLRPILVHQRIDFSLYSMDQIVNNAAKWFSMFGGQKNVPLVVRMIIGRGWGQGNQHSQNLTSIYAHIPGLKIVMPSNAYDAKGLFISAVKDPNPVLFIEHRWLYETTSDVPEEMYGVPVGVNRNYLDWNSEAKGFITIVSSGHATKESLLAKKFLQEEGVYTDVLDLRTIKPLPIESIKHSVMHSGRLVVVDDSWRSFGIAAEVIASVCEDERVQLKHPPIRVTYPDYPSASSPALTKHYYPGPLEIFQACARSLNIALDDSKVRAYQEARVHDVPDQNFKGPF